MFCLELKTPTENVYAASYASPLGELVLTSDGAALASLSFAEGAGCSDAAALSGDSRRSDGNLPIFAQAKSWLDRYFSGRDPGFCVPLAPAGSVFRRSVWKLILSIPFGQTATYGDIAARYARMRGVDFMAPQAIGNAVGRNPIPIFIPCHRVIGANGALTGFSGGLTIKEKLLQIERIRPRLLFGVFE